MKKISKEVKIGIAFIIALFILYYGISFLKGINKFKPANAYVVVFDNVEGLTKSAPITLNGFQVGLVASMELDKNHDGKVMAYLNMDKGIEITKGSKISLDVSMLGNATLVLEMNPYTEEYATKEDTIYGQRNKGLMDAANTMAPQIGALIPKIDSILSGIQILVNNPALEQSLANVNAITKDLAASSKQLNLMTNSLSNEVPTILGNINTISSDLSGVTRTISELNIKSTFNSMDSTIKNMEYLSQKVKQKDNNVGLLLNDRQLYDSLNVTIGNAAALLKDVKEHPDRYISVKIF